MSKEQEATDPGGQDQDAACPFPTPKTLLSPLTLHSIYLLIFNKNISPSLSILFKELHLEEIGQGLNMPHTEKACCIFVPSLRKEPVTARGKSSTIKSQNRKENDTW